MAMSLRSTIYNICTSYVLLQFVQPGDAIQCYICNSRRDSRCLDPFNATAANALDPISCASVMSTRRFITYFAKLLTTLGIPVSAEDDAYFGNKKYLNEQESAACQKVKIQDGYDTVIIRTCSILSSIVCEPPVDQLSRSLQYTFCEVCVTDYCNAGFIIEANFYALLLSAIILYFVRPHNF